MSLAINNLISALSYSLAFMLLAIAGPLPVNAQNTAEEDKLRLEGVDAALAFFVLEAISMREELRERGMESRADRLWGASTELIQIIRFASVEDAELFLPIVDGFSRTLQGFSQVDGPLDDQAWSDFQTALDEQVNIYSNPGAYSGGHDVVAVSINAVRGTEQVDGLYVTIDLFGAVPKGPSANPLNKTTSPATGRSGTGRHLIRVYSGDRLVGQRVVRIGGTGLEESFDVRVE